MIVGDPRSFAIAAEVRDIVDGWVLGRFAFWVDGKMIGDWEDSTDLRGCAKWLREFADKPVDRRNLALDGLSAEQLVQRIVDDVAPSSEEMKGRAKISAEEIMRSAEVVRRFQISHVGMSSFDQFDLLLLDNCDGTQRFVWRDVRRNQVFEARVVAEDVREVAREYADWVEGLPRNSEGPGPE